MPETLRISWSRMPFVRLLAPVVLALILHRHFELPWALPVFVMAAVATALLQLRYVHYRYRWVRGALINLALFFMTIAWAQVTNPRGQATHYVHYVGQQGTYSARVLGASLEKARSYKLEVEVERMVLNELQREVRGKAILYLAKDSLAETLQAGQEIIFRTTFQRHQPPPNPGQFDYGGHLENRGITCTSYLTSSNWQLGQGKVKGLAVVIAGFRQELLQLLEQGLSEEEAQIASALLLGYKEDLDPELRSAFSNAGAMHVLAVSGLHVGIVFMALNFLLGWMERLRHGKVIKMLLIIALIWCYALLTGSSPSVQRASFMFSMIGFAGVLGRTANILNTLAASAFAMLFWDPNLLFNVGFQLSYAAVFGIVMLYPFISPLVASRYMLVNKAWDLTAVSIAAQISTLPFILFYFHQIPVYAVLSNLIIIPAAFGIIALGGVYLLFAWMPTMAEFFGSLLSIVLRTTNGAMKWIAQLPAPTLEVPHVGLFEAILLAVLVFTLSLFLMYRVRYTLHLALVCVACMLTLGLWKGYQTDHQHTLVVLSQKQGTAIAEINGNTFTLWADTAVLADDYLMRTAEDMARHFRTKKPIPQILERPSESSILVAMKGRKVMVTADYRSAAANVEYVVLPVSTRPWQEEQARETFDRSKVHHLGRDGAFVLE